MPVMRDVKGKSLFPLFICGTLLVFLFTGKSFAMSFGQGMPHPPKGDATQAARQTVNVNEKLQRGTGTLPFAAKLKTASGGPDKKLRRVIGGSILETWNSTGDSLRISVKSPLVSQFLQTDPIGYRDSMNLYQALNQSPMNFLDPLGNFYFVPYKDPNRNRIIGALAAGATTQAGEAVFWNIFNDKRPIIIKSNRLPDTQIFRFTPGINDPRRQKPTLGETQKYTIDNKARVTSIMVNIDFVNIERYWEESQSNTFKIWDDYLANLNEKRCLEEILEYGNELEHGFGQGRIDQYGITTIYHELFHVNAYQSSSPETGIVWTHGFVKGKRQDWPISPYGNAQFFGEKVFNEFKNQYFNFYKFLSYIQIIEGVQLKYYLSMIRFLLPY